jgi:MOSC domain-containing protein YiiM
MAGRVLQLSIKPKTPGEHGLPKRAVLELRVTSQGADGDYNHYRATTLDGDPDQAILIVTKELLARLGAEGWPIRPGDLGENLTLDDVPEAALGPGARVELADVVLEVTKPCDPCIELHSLPYVGPTRGPEFVRTLVGRRGWYARVLSPGIVRPGCPVTVVAGGGAPIARS